MQELLRRFNGDIHTKEALIDFLHEFIDQEAIKRVYAKEDTSAVADARILLDGAFEYLSNEYGIKERRPEPENTAR